MPFVYIVGILTQKNAKKQKENGEMKLDNDNKKGIFTYQKSFLSLLRNHPSICRSSCLQGKDSTFVFSYFKTEKFTWLLSITKPLALQISALLKADLVGLTLSSYIVIKDNKIIVDRKEKTQQNNPL